MNEIIHNLTFMASAVVVFCIVMAIAFGVRKSRQKTNNAIVLERYSKPIWPTMQEHDWCGEWKEKQ